jgi:tetratricopeptide (TPR) repeat protein
MFSAEIRGSGRVYARTGSCTISIFPLTLLIVALLGSMWLHFPVYAQTSGGGAETHVGLGYEALKRDQYEEAAAEFRAALTLDPSLVLRARFPLAVALFEAHKPAEARKEFEAVGAAVGEHPNVSYYLGRLDLDERNYSAAIRNLKRAILKPPFPDTSYYLGFAYFKAGQLTLATKYLEEALKLNAEDARVAYQLGLAYRQQGRTEEARKMLAISQTTRQRANDRSRLRTDCAQKLQQGPPESARPICDQLFENDNADSLTALGSLYGQHGMLQDALRAFRRAAELAPHSPQTQYNLALTYYQLNEYQQASEHLKEALARWPDLFPLNSLYGAVLLKTADDSAAAKALRHAHELNPQDAATSDLLYDVVVRLAQHSKAGGSHSESLKLWQEAAQLRPEESLPHRSMAEIYAAMGKAAEASGEQQQAEHLSQPAGKSEPQ